MSPWLSDLVLRSQSDERLVSLARAGHDRAFVAIVERYERRLLAFAAHLGAGGRAEDVVQQAFLSAFAALRAEREVTHLSGWLHQIVRNGVAGMSIARAASELQPETSSGADLEDHVASRIEARSLLADLARLPERQRDALVLTSLQGRSRSEVALSLGTTEGAVRQMVHRARTSLRNAAGAVVPMPLVAAAARGSIRGAHVGGATATSVGGGVALKAGAIIAAGGLVAAGLTVSHHGFRPPRIGSGRAAKVERHATFSASLVGRISHWDRAPDGGIPGSLGRAGASRTGPLHAEAPRRDGSVSDPRQTSGEAAPSGSDTHSQKPEGGSGGGSGEAGSSGSGTSSSSGGSGQDGTGDSTSTTSGSTSTTSGSTSTTSGSTDSGSTSSSSTGSTSGGDTSTSGTSTSGTSTDSSGTALTSSGD